MGNPFSKTRTDSPGAPGGLLFVARGKSPLRRSACGSRSPRATRRKTVLFPSAGVGTLVENQPTCRLGSVFYPGGCVVTTVAVGGLRKSWEGPTLPKLVLFFVFSRFSLATWGPTRGSMDFRKASFLHPTPAGFCRDDAESADHSA